MRKFILLLAVILAIASTGAAYAAPPPGGPPGLEQAIAAQEKHNPHLLSTPGVVGTAVGMREDGTVVVKVFTERPGVTGLPAAVDNIPVVVQVTGKIMALRANPPSKPAPTTVTITSPADGSHFGTGDSIHFAATARDRNGNDLSASIRWNSSIQGYLSTGASFSMSLNDGTHKITASVTDSRGKTVSSSVTITVGDTSQLKTTDVWPRPVPIGISTGNADDISAGTIACRVTDGTNVYALSNTHVYAPKDIDGQTELNDIIMQPGRYDTPNHLYNESYRLGTLFAYSPIDGYGWNEIDAAIALTDASSLGNSTPPGGYGTPSSTTITATVNMPVQKFGRTTQLTKGKITGINATVIVGYSADWYAFFKGQIIVETTTAFILPGDSGSLMVTDNEACNPVGLLFAGNDTGTYAIANPIDLVLEYFHVTIDGK